MPTNAKDGVAVWVGWGGEGEDSSVEKIAAVNFKMPPCFPSTPAKFCRLGKSYDGS